MDAGDPLTASGVPFLFAEYDVSADGQWRRVVDKIPRRGERIRWTGT
jgi:hypothetical protein